MSYTNHNFTIESRTTSSVEAPFIFGLSNREDETTVLCGFGLVGDAVLKISVLKETKYPLGDFDELVNIRLSLSHLTELHRIIGLYLQESHSGAGALNIRNGLCEVPLC